MNDYDFFKQALIGTFRSPDLHNDTDLLYFLVKYNYLDMMTIMPALTVVKTIHVRTGKYRGKVITYPEKTTVGVEWAMYNTLRYMRKKLDNVE